ncbi:hypothetical protein NDU88_007764 [Pleurodeles waltl]|uniref:Uncharacterized protein n=1 Tax=Pleurodeles waltl TaxID=8319 RepID=A0AAV7U126_PLEWA|nr:hypothetical protein NDU88_007764 [Pleurodeles waltl]
MEKRPTAQQRYMSVSLKTCNRMRELKEGDLVRLRSPRAMVKGTSKFSGWKRKIQVGESAIKLDDGKWWNKSKISGSKVVDVEENAVTEWSASPAFRNGDTLLGLWRHESASLESGIEETRHKKDTEAKVENQKSTSDGLNVGRTL